ncbi:MAG: peptide chain release factor 2 [Planctomycetota bacterium]
MTVEINNRLQTTGELIARVKDAARFQEEVERLAALEAKMADSDFWEDQERAAEVIAKLKRSKEVVQEIRSLEARWSDLTTLLELAIEESDPASTEEVDRESRQLLKDAEGLELRTLLGGTYDGGNCFLSIHAGAGGTESCDWVTMLRRMYLRWAERNSYASRVIDELPGEETGSKSVTIRIAGPWAYGYLRSEIGVHRLVRISPFDAKSRRHTSFASVDVSPEVEELEIAIDETELRIDTYRSRGAGGQHVNTTDSAVRITHLPTGIVVQCQNERSQHSNRAQAMRVLKSRIVQLEEKKREEELARIGGDKGEIAFGSQIRSYVLHPYKMVRDHRSDTETGNIDAVLDGDLQLLIEAYLRQHARNQ